MDRFRITDTLIAVLLLLFVPQASLALSEKEGDGEKMKLQADKYYQNEQFSEALTLYTRAMESAKATNDEKTVIACLGNIGNIYAYMGDEDRAIHYFLKCYNQAGEDKNLMVQHISAINLVGAYSDKGDLANARKFFKIQMSSKFPKDPRFHYYALCNQSLIAKTAHDYPSALYYQRKTLEFVVDNNLGPEFLSSTHNELGNILFLSEKYKEAIGEYKIADSIAQKANLKGIESTVCRRLYVVYNKIGDKDSATFYKNRYLALDDSLFDQQRMNAAKNKLYDYEDRENNAIIGNLTTRNNYLTVSVIVFILLSIVIATLYIKLRQRNKSLLDSEKLLVEKNKDLMKQNDETRTLRHQYIEALGSSDSRKQDDEHTDATTSQDGEKGESLLNAEQTNRLLEKINNVLEDVNIISSDDFSLSKLAQLVGSNTKYVSMVINDTYGKNFKTYLNEFRIREACRRLSDEEHYGNITIQGIYRELGFKTATGFNQAFRRVCGMTPSQYQKLSRQQ